jgi:hypothetical protein
MYHGQGLSLFSERERGEYIFSPVQFGGKNKVAKASNWISAASFFKKSDVDAVFSS